MLCSSAGQGYYYLHWMDGWLAPSWTEWSDRLSDTFLCSCLIFCRLLLIINITMEFCLFQSDSYVRTPMAVSFLYEEFFFSCCGWTIWRSANTNIISWNNIWRLLYKWSKIMTRICSTIINRIPRSGLHVLYGFRRIPAYLMLSRTVWGMSVSELI